MTSIEARSNVSVAILMTSFLPSPVGGAEMQAFRLAKSLKAKGSDVCIVTLAQKGLPTRDEVDGIPVFRIRLVFSPFYHKTSSLIQNQSAVVRIEYERNDKRNFEISKKKSVFGLFNYAIFLLYAYLLLRKRKPDLIYSPVIEWLACVATILGKLLKTPTVVKDSTVNGMTNILRYPGGHLIRKLITKNCYFVAMTRAIKSNFLAAGVPEGKIFHIPNGVALPTVTWAAGDRHRFIFVGNLHQQPAKGVDILLKAWRIVLSEIPHAELYIIGDGNLPAYRKYVKNLSISERLHFLGKQRDFEHLLTEAFAFILPSRREGMSNALLEAMALGMPCIATDISGNQDLITDKINGLLIPTEDEDALAKAVFYLYNHPEEAAAMGREARKTIDAKYKLQSITKEYDELFKMLKKSHRKIGV